MKTLWAINGIKSKQGFLLCGINERQDNSKKRGETKKLYKVLALLGINGPNNPYGNSSTFMSMTTHIYLRNL